MHILLSSHPTVKSCRYRLENLNMVKKKVWSGFRKKVWFFKKKVFPGGAGRRRRRLRPPIKLISIRNVIAWTFNLRSPPKWPFLANEVKVSWPSIRTFKNNSFENWFGSRKKISSKAEEGKETLLWVNRSLLRVNYNQDLVRKWLWRSGRAHDW